MPDDKAFAIEAFAVGGWKTEYYADRGPRLHFRLCNVPKGVEEVDLLTYTSISEQEPGRSELKSSQLHVKQVLEGNSMKLWFNCFQLNCCNPPVIFRTKTKTQVRAWITTIEEDSFVGGNSASRGHGKSRGGRLNRARTQGSSSPSSTSNVVSSGASMSGYCWLKPSDTKVWCSFANNVFSVSSTPGGPVTQSWNLASTSAPRAQVHTSHVTLTATNNWQATAVYKLQVGFHGEQQFVCHIKSSVPAGFKTRSPWRSPFFVVKSCNRHVASKAEASSSTVTHKKRPTPSLPSKILKCSPQHPEVGRPNQKVHVLAAAAAAAAAAGSSMGMLRESALHTEHSPSAVHQQDYSPHKLQKFGTSVDHRHGNSNDLKREHDQNLFIAAGSNLPLGPSASNNNGIIIQHSSTPHNQAFHLRGGLLGGTPNAPTKVMSPVGPAPNMTPHFHNMPGQSGHSIPPPMMASSPAGPMSSPEGLMQPSSGTAHSPLMAGKHPITQDFMAKGFHILSPEAAGLAPELHWHIFSQREHMDGSDSRSLGGCNMLAQFPELDHIVHAPKVREVLVSVLGSCFELVEAKACLTATPNMAAEHVHQTTLFRLARSCPQRVRHVVMLYFPQAMSAHNSPIEVVEGSHLFGALGVEDLRQLSQWHDLNCKLAGMHGFEACRRFIGPGEFPANWGQRRVVDETGAGAVMFLHEDVWFRYLSNRTQQNRHVFEFHFVRVEEPVLGYGFSSTDDIAREVSKKFDVFDDRTYTQAVHAQEGGNSSSDTHSAVHSSAPTTASAAASQSDSAATGSASDAGGVGSSATRDEEKPPQRALPGAALEIISQSMVVWAEMAPSQHSMRHEHRGSQDATSGRDSAQRTSGSDKSSKGSSKNPTADSPVARSVPVAVHKIQVTESKGRERARLSIQDLNTAMVWNPVAWGTPQGIDDASKEPGSVAAAFLLATHSTGASTLLNHLATRLVPISSIAPPDHVQSARDILARRNLQSTVRRHAINALACCSRRELVEKLAPDVLYMIQNHTDPLLREDAVFILGEWAWMHDVKIVTRNPHDGSSSYHELSVFAVSLLTQLVESDQFPHVRLAAAQALGNYAAIIAARFGHLTSLNPAQQPHIGVFTMTLQLQLQSISSALSKCLRSEIEPAVQCEILFAMLRFANCCHALDCGPVNAAIGMLRHVARFAPNQRTQSLALAVLHRMHTYQSLQCLVGLLVHRRWTVLNQ